MPSFSRNESTFRASNHRPGRWRSGWAVVLLLGVFAQAPAFAEEAEAEDHTGGRTAHDDPLAHRNHFAGIIGWSHKETGKCAYSWGMEYTRMLSRRIGVGAFMEMTEGQFEADTFGLILVGRPSKKWALYAGPGIERSLFVRQEYLAHIGAAYLFQPKGVVVAPLIRVEYVSGHNIYFLGVAVGKGF